MLISYLPTPIQRTHNILTGGVELWITLFIRENVLERLMNSSDSSNPTSRDKSSREIISKIYLNKILVTAYELVFCLQHSQKRFHELSGDGREALYHYESSNGIIQFNFVETHFLAEDNTHFPYFITTWE